MFDINDFDETHHGPWEWDLKRLAVSVVLASRERGFNDDAASRAVSQLVGTYRRRMQDYARISQLELWYSKVGFEQLLARAPNDIIRQQLLKLADKARGQTQAAAENDGAGKRQPAPA
jgi:uncharacterized protein (DUF2252 family)